GTAASESGWPCGVWNAFRACGHGRDGCPRAGHGGHGRSHMATRRRCSPHNRGMSEFIVGLTGGVASGKSAVAQRFKARGVFVADADVAAREAVAPGSDGLAEVVAAFGADVLAADGALDRAAMRRRIFDDDQARARLEAIIHPRVRTALRAACEAAPGAYAVAAI